MSELTKNFNLLSPTGFRVTIESPRFANFEYFLTSVNLPTVTLPGVESTYRNFQGFVTGDKLDYDEIAAEFAIDEDMKNYEELYEWLKDNAKDPTLHRHDIILSILSSHNNVNRQFRFVNAMPISIEGVEFSTQNTDIQYLKSRVTLRYDYFTIIK